jgi:hypothetical protein
MLAMLKDHRVLSRKANSVSLNVVACAMALHGGEQFYSDREAKRTFGVPVKTDVGHMAINLEILEERINQIRVRWQQHLLATGEGGDASIDKFHAGFSAPPTADTSAYRRPTPVPGRKRGRPPISSYTPEEMLELGQRREAKRHHEATWRERAAARDADRAEKAAVRAAASAERDAARNAARAEKAAAREAAREAARAEKAAAREAAREAAHEAARKAVWEAARGEQAAALQQLRMTDAVEAQCDRCKQWYALAEPPLCCSQLATGPCTFAMHVNAWQPLFRFADGRIDHPRGWYKREVCVRIVRHAHYEQEPSNLPPNPLLRLREHWKPAEGVVLDRAEPGCHHFDVYTETRPGCMPNVWVQPFRDVFGRYRVSAWGDIACCAWCGATDGLEDDAIVDLGPSCNSWGWPDGRRKLSAQPYCQPCWAAYRAHTATNSFA